jgi:hypothetical protein
MKLPKEKKLSNHQNKTPIMLSQQRINAEKIAAEPFWELWKHVRWPDHSHIPLREALNVLESDAPVPENPFSIVAKTNNFKLTAHGPA